MKLLASLAIIVALAVTGCGGSSREESALGKSVNAVFDENPGTMARYCHFHVNVVEKGMYDAEFFQRDVRAFEEGVGFKLLREYHEHGVKPEDIVRMINRRCEHADKGNSKTEATAQPTSSISQLQHEAAAQHEIAQGYLRQTEQIVREGIAKGEEYASEKEHAKSVRLIKLERAAQSRADALHRQMCELVLQDPRTPHNDRLGRIALECE